jgi:hypothetical protein
MTVKWIDSGREPQCPANPEYPDGQDIKAPAGAKVCKIELPYPAKRCGMYLITCSRCGCNSVVTTAGRRDDPRSVEMPCIKQVGNA